MYRYKFKLILNLDTGYIINHLIYSSIRLNIRTMKILILIITAFLILSSVNAQQQRLKKGDVFTYHSSTIEGVEALKRYTAEYKIVDVLKDGYQMEARFRLKDEYDDIYKIRVNDKRVTKKIYPEFDDELFRYHYNNSLFTREAVRFKVSFDGILSEIKLIDPIVGKDIIMDDVLMGYLEKEFGCPYLGQTNSVKKGDQFFYRNRYYNVDSVMSDVVILKSLSSSEAKKKRSTIGVRINKSKKIKTYFSGSSIKYKIIIEKNTGLIKEFNSLSSKRKERLVQVPNFKSFHTYFLRDSVKTDTIIKKPNVRIKGKVLNPINGLAEITLKRKLHTSFDKQDFKYLISLKNDSTFEFRIHLDDLEHFDLEYKNNMAITLQPGDDLKMNLTVNNDNLIANDISGVGSENLNFQQTNNPYTSEIYSLYKKFEHSCLLLNSRKKVTDLKNNLKGRKEFLCSILQDTTGLSIDINSPKGLTPKQIKEVLDNIPNDILKSIVNSIQKESNLIFELENGTDEKIDINDQINVFAKVVSNDFNWKKKHFETLSPEMYLSEYFNNLKTLFKFYNRASISKSIKTKEGWKDTFPYVLKKYYNEIPELKYYNSKNDLLRFNNISDPFRYMFDWEYSTQIPNSHKSINDNHKPGSQKSNKIRYNLIENHYEGYSAYYLKYQTVYQSLNYDKKTNYTTLYNRFMDEYPDTKYAQILSKQYKKVEKVSPGSKAFNFKLKDLDGNTVKLSDFRDKVVYIDFNAKQNDYKKDFKRTLSDFFDHGDIVFITVLVKDKNFEKNLKWFVNIQEPIIKLVATTEEFKTISQKYQLKDYREKAIIDVDSRIVTHIAPSIVFIHAYPQLLYRALISHPQKIDNERKIRILKAVITIVVLVLILSFIAWDIYRRRTKKKIKESAIETKIRELELTAIRAQMNPHFMYNCLNSIQNLVQKKQNDEAHQYISKFAELIRSVLKNSDKEEISLATELEMITNYVDLEKLRFDIDYSIQIAQGIDNYSVFIPPLILQPLAENAILHGLAPKAKDRKLKIEILQNTNKDICVSIIDNGIGRNGASKKKSSNGKGIGFSQERLNLLADKYGTQYHMNIEDLKDEHENAIGTKVQICFPEE